MDRRLSILIILLLTGGTLLSLAAYFSGIFTFDLRVSLWLSGVQNPVIFTIMNMVSFFGDSWIPLISVAIVAGYCFFSNKRIEAVFVIATLSSSIIAGVLKVLIARPRPSALALNFASIFQPFNQYSYPSGHVLFYVVFFGFLAFLAWKHLMGWTRRVIISLCVVLILLIGPSRLYLGDHWLSDVIGSYIIGSLWLIILILLYMMVLRRRGEVLQNEHSAKL